MNLVEWVRGTGLRNRLFVAELSGNVPGKTTSPGTFSAGTLSILKMAGAP